MLQPASPEHERRIVLVDLDWQEADLLPRLLRQPGLVVGLVAGEDPDSAGVRAAEMCGLRRTVEIADLTREIFDLALVGAHSSRRHQVVRLLNALGTPVESPQGFFDGAPAANGNGHHPEALHEDPVSEIPDDAVELDRLLERAIPDVTALPPAAPATDPAPSPDDRGALARQIERWVAASHGASAVLCIAGPSGFEPLCGSGPEDAVLDSVVRLAADEEAPVILGRLDESGHGKTWGAWPFRTRRHRGILAAAGFDPVEGRAFWEQAAQGLRVAWEEGERDRSGTGLGASWLDRAAFRARAEAAVDAHRTEGTPFAALRLVFGGSPAALDHLCERLPARMRGSDALCRANVRTLLVLHDGTSATYAHVWRRIAALWEEAWRASGHDSPAPPPAEERIDLTGAGHAEGFLGAVRRWLSEQS